MNMPTLFSNNAQKVVFLSLLTGILLNPSITFAHDSSNKEPEKQVRNDSYKVEEMHDDTYIEKDKKEQHTVYIINPEKKVSNDKPCVSPTAKPTANSTQKPLVTATSAPTSATAVTQAAVNTPSQGSVQTVVLASNPEVKQVSVKALAYTGHDTSKQANLPIILGILSVFSGLVILKRLAYYERGLK